MTVCGAQTRNATPCQRPSGWGTQHVGEGRCKLHGGNAGRPIKHGRYSLAHRTALQAKVRAFLDDPAPGDLTGELALMRALMQDFLDRFDDDVPLKLTDIKAIMEMIEKIGQLVERIAKILNNTALTQAEVQYLQARLADLIVKYIDDPDERAAFISELDTSLGSIGGGARASIASSIG